MQLQIIIGAEQILPESQAPLRCGLVTCNQRLANIAFTATRQGDQTSMVSRDPITLSDRIASLLTCCISAAQQATKTAVTIEVLAQQQQAMMFCRRRLIFDQHISAHNGFNACSKCCAMKLHQRIEIALVCYRDSRHPCRQTCLHQRLDTDDAIRQRKLRMDPQMDETDAHDSFSTNKSRTGLNERR